MTFIFVSPSREKIAFSHISKPSKIVAIIIEGKQTKKRVKS